MKATTPAGSLLAMAWIGLTTTAASSTYGNRFSLKLQILSRYVSVAVLPAVLALQSLTAQHPPADPWVGPDGFDQGFDWLMEPGERLSLPLWGGSLAPAECVVSRPLTFERNDGQVAAEVAYVSRGRGYSLFLTGNEAVIVLKTPRSQTNPKPSANAALDAGSSSERVLRMRLVGANSSPSVGGEEITAAKANFLIGNNPALWRTNVPIFSKVRYREAYPGIDLVYYGNEGQLEYDFVVAPGADPSQILMEFEGAEELAIQDGGDLLLKVGCQEVRCKRPVVFQELNGERFEIEGRFRIQGASGQSAMQFAANSTQPSKDVREVERVAFELAAYDPTLPLVIDPILLYSSYLGGSGDDKAHGVAVDSQGNVYVAGPTASTDFPTRNAANRENAGGQNDVFVSKFSPAGQLIFSTYLGGTGDDGSLFDPLRIAVSQTGECYIVGATASWDFPLVNAVQDWFGGGAGDAFVTALKTDGSALTFSTYYGGSLGEGARNIAFGPAGDIYVVGSTLSADFPVLNAFQSTMGSADGTDRDAFIIRIGAGDHRIVYSTFLGTGTTKEWAHDVAVDDQGNAYAALWVAHSIYDRYQWAIVKLSPDGRSRIFDRRLPTVLTDFKYVGFPPFLALAPNNTLVMAGYAWGLPLPAANQPNPATNPTLSMGTAGGWPDMYLARLSATNGTFLSAVYFGGSGSEEPKGLSVTPAGDIIVSGTTWPYPQGFETHPIPVTDPLEGGPVAGASANVFVAKFRLHDLSLASSTLFGGSGDEIPVDMALDARGNPWIAGVVQVGRTNAQLPILTPFQSQPGGSDDAFLAHLSLRDARVQLTRSGRNVSLSWPIEAADYVLEATTSLVETSWGTVTNNPTLGLSECSVQLPLAESTRFFRLRKQ